MDDKLYLLCTIFAARADITNSSLLYDQANGNFTQECFDALCILWPELMDPNGLSFVFQQGPSDDQVQLSDPNDLMMNLLEVDNKLIPIIELEHDIVHERSEKVKDFVSKRILQLEQDSLITFDNILSNWLRRRILVCDEFNPNNVLFNEPLWETHSKDDIKFAQWISGIIKPLSYLNLRSGSKTLKIKDFENFKPVDIINLILGNINDDEYNLSIDASIIIQELIPYLKYSKAYDIFLDIVFNPSVFRFDTAVNYYNFRQLYSLLSNEIPIEFKEKLEELSLKIIYDNSANMLNVTSSSELEQLLTQFSPGTKVKSTSLTANNLKWFAHYMNLCFQGYSLSDINAICQSSEQEQLAHFASMVKGKICNSQSQQTIDVISNLISESKIKEKQIFTNLTIDKQISIFVEILLELGEFDLLQNFVTLNNSKLEENVLEKYFWNFFNNATNGLKSRPEIKKAEKTLQLMDVQNSTVYKHLHTLLKVADTLSRYSINLGKGIPFKPCNIFEFKYNPSKLISILLELNRDLYKDVANSMNLIDQLVEAMQISREHLDRESEYNKILVIHIDHALVNMDFTFAFQKSKELLRRDSVSTYWATVFQVCKFINPNWIDSEVPTEYLILQLELLGDLLSVCPADGLDIVVSQWSGAELELSTRNLIDDKYSIENMGSGNEFSQAINLLNDVSNSFTNFLSAVNNN
ncbi:hypothetical protein Kpol_520p38 [Vanderwaltozyma polyspora DSM 70294]|uniref:Sec39 domain-containing protein n=1 Tax=Vanderwaltozyma polyspora (strain ATCC 22028 / DSM 70294 / BCRC 21397 / CBS 2163 / NBRC 10782 / NRRL Y-8283 / UCD 57-17) TaxID=436907 RepID=A7TMC1_VANPO|nr:uncharacterized protein Kpol_520p38 [Vanderwaltozyma polyspora DSM 70294]EDO16615.1 hypothetical protein Kpol_520p38 [Vanderwaltozyma polyspora DSM 70294]